MGTLSNRVCFKQAIFNLSAWPAAFHGTFIPLHSGTGSETQSAQSAWQKPAEGQQKAISLQIILNKSCTLPALFPDSWCERTPSWPEGQLHLAKKKPLKDHLRNLQVLVRTSLSVPCAEVVASPETCRKENQFSRSCFRQAEGLAGKQAPRSSSACANNSRIL